MVIVPNPPPQMTEKEFVVGIEESALPVSCSLVFVYFVRSSIHVHTFMPYIYFGKIDLCYSRLYNTSIYVLIYKETPILNKWKWKKSLNMPLLDLILTFFQNSIGSQWTK